MKQCPKCGSDHNKLGIFCSRKCANSRVFSDETNARRSISNKETSLNYWESRRTVYCCKGCGEQYVGYQKSNKCENCRSAAKRPAKVKKDTVPKMLPIDYTKRLIVTGELLQLKESVIRKHVKRWLVHNIGHKCQICGVTEWCGKPVPLVCDHIDGDSTNSDIANFRNVCCNCDAQLDTYKSKNRGKGRSYDREQYHKMINKKTESLAESA